MASFTSAPATAAPADPLAQPGPPPRYDLAPPMWSGPESAGRYWDLLHNLVSRAIKLRYKRSVLGFAWTMLNPLVTMVILTAVFSAVFATTVPDYPVFVIIGLLAWNLFALGSSQGLTSVVDSGQLIRKVGVPKVIFPVAAVAANFVNLLLSLAPLLAMILVFRVRITWAVVWLPVGVVLIAGFTLGVALFLATLNVFFRDVRYFYEAALLAWFYATPIFYPVTILAPRTRAILQCNPLYVLIEVFRAPLYAGTPPSWGTLAIAATESLGALVLGWGVFRRYQAHFIEYI